MVKTLGKASQSTTRWREKMPWSTEMEQQESGKVTHNSKSTEHFNHRLVLRGSEPYFTSSFFTTEKWVQIIIQILFQNHLHCY